MSTDARISPCLREIMTDFIDSILNFGTYLFRDFKLSIEWMPPFGFWTVNRFEWELVPLFKPEVGARWFS